MKKSFLIGITFLILACSETPKKEFSLHGTTTGFEDDSYLYLSIGDVIDSTLVNDNQFSFSTKFYTYPAEALLRDKDYSNYRFLWLQNNSMTIDASNSSLKKAAVTGSETETQAQNFRISIDTLEWEEQLQKKMAFIEFNPNSIISPYLLSIYATTWGKDKTTSLYSKLTESNKHTDYGKKIANYLDLAKEPKVGEPFVDFEMNDAKGQMKKLSNLKGKTILLEFWASWCGPCRKENPNLLKTYNEFNEKGFEVFAVSLDENKEDWFNAIHEDKLKWLNVSDLQGDQNEASLIYGVVGIPDNFLIDKNGVIIGRDLRGEKLRSKLSETLN